MRRMIMAGAIIVGAVVGVMPLGASAGVVAYWDFGPNSRGIGDASGNGHFLVNNGVTFADGAAVFDGSQTTFSTRDWLDLSACSNLTVEAFFKSQTGAGDLVLFEHTENFNSHWGAFISYLSYGQLWGGFNGMGAYNTEKSEPGICADGQWHHLALVIHAQTSGVEVLDLFLDGVKQTDVNVEGISGFCTAGTFFIGSRENNGIKFIGALDDVRISDQALSTNEFLQARSVSPPPANVIAYWPFAPGNELSDNSGNGHSLVSDGVTFSQGAAVLNGAQAAFNTASPLDLSAYSGITIEAYVKSTSGGDNIVFEHGANWNSETGGILSFFGSPDGQLNAGYRAAGFGGYNYDRTDPGVVTDGRWHHFALTIDLTKSGVEIAQLYVDGWKQFDVDGYGLITPLLNSVFYIGSRANSVAKMTGQLDDIRITDRVLAPWEFLQSRTVAPPDVIAYWPFHPGNDMDDASGNGNSLTNSGITFYNGAAVISETAVVFSSVNWICLSSYPAVTVEAFIHSDSDNLGIVLEHTANFNDVPGGFIFSVNESTFGSPYVGKLAAGSRTFDGYNFESTDSGALADSRWHHMAMVLDPSTNRAEQVRLYFDGVRQSDVPSFVGEWSSRLMDAPLYIGSRSNSLHRFKGSIDDLRITGRALTPAEFLSERTKTFGTLFSIK